MTESNLQDEFLRVFADGHIATANRILARLAELGVSTTLLNNINEIVHDEIRGLYHGSLVVFDGGSSLADHGMIQIVDDKGIPLVGHLHELGFRHYDERA